MAGVSAVDPRVCFAELCRWPDDGRRYELYDGEVIVVPSPLHLINMMEVARVRPDLAVEVLSRSTEWRDRGRKMELLARSGVPEYWIADPVRNVLEIYELKDGRYLLTGAYQEPAQVCSPTLDGLTFDVHRVFEE